MRTQSVTTFALLALTGTLAAGAILAQDDASVAPASAIQIALPFNKAVVRESVPVRLREFPKGGYAAISIDGQFVSAQALPASPRAPVYVWDTKAGLAASDDSGAVKPYSDGSHALTVAVFDAKSKPVGKDTVAVQLANKIALPSGQGIKLAYPWKTSRDLRYQRRTGLTADSAASTNGPQTVQESRLRFERTVENDDGGQYLIRDEIIPVDRSARPKPFVSYVATRGQISPVGVVRALYRVVDTRGRVLSTLPAENRPNSLGFSIPVLPPRRVSVGAHWQAPVQMTLDWTSFTPTTVQATGTLEGFEWQDRYPTAKIRETYEGPAVFRPGPGSPLPLVFASSIKYERVIYFAYNAGRIVRTQTNLTLTSTAPGLLSAGAFGGGGGYPGGGFGGGGYPGGGYPGGGYPGGGFGGGFRRGGFRPGGFSGGGYPGGGFSGYPGGGGGYPGGGFGGGGYPGGGGGYPGGGFGGYPGGGYPGGGFSGYPGGGFSDGGGFTPPSFGGAAGGADAGTKLTYTETSVLI